MAAQELCRDRKGLVFGAVVSPCLPHSWFILSPGPLQLGSPCHQIPGTWMSLTHLGRSLLLYKDFCLLHIK